MTEHIQNIDITNRYNDITNSVLYISDFELIVSQHISGFMISQILLRDTLFYFAVSLIRIGDITKSYFVISVISISDIKKQGIYGKTASHKIGHITL